MEKFKTIFFIAAAAAVLACSCAARAAAADNATEFGVEDDLTVFGTEGVWDDPDSELRGFTIIGSTDGPRYIDAAPGNLVVRGNLQADSTSYFASSVTVAGYAVLQSTVQIGEGNLKFGAGAAGLVMKSYGDGFVYWGPDNAGGVSPGSPHRLTKYDAAGNNIEDSLLQQNDLGTNVTLIGLSSFTVNGDAHFGNDVNVLNRLSVNNNATVLGDLGLAGSAVFGDAPTDKVSMWGPVTVMNTSSMTVTGALLANGNTQLGDNSSGLHSVNRDAEAGVALSVEGAGISGNYIIKFYSGGTLAGWIKRK